MRSMPNCSIQLPKHLQAGLTDFNFSQFALATDMSDRSTAVLLCCVIAISTADGLRLLCSSIHCFHL